MPKWSHEMDAQLIKLKNEGYSGAQIAAALPGDLTRNAVIGRINRLGIGTGRKISMTPKAIEHRAAKEHRKKWAGRAAPKQKPSLRVASNAAFVYDFNASYEKAKVLTPRTSAPRVVRTIITCTEADKRLADAPLNLTMMDLEANSCRWPVNDPPPRGEHLFCGHPKRFGSYCAAHAERSVGIGTRSEALADRMPIQRAA